MFIIIVYIIIFIISGWTLLTCCDCGSHARHKICESLNLAVTSWKCEECISFERKSMYIFTSVTHLNSFNC